MRLGPSRIIFATLLFAVMIVSITDRGVSAAPAAELLELAEGEFSNLTPAETALLKFAGSYRSESGEFAAAGPSTNPDDPTNDPARADRWGAEREVRAELIRWLCVDPHAKALIDPQGIRLLGARITGKLNLSDVKVPFPLVLRNCSIAERMTFESAVFPRLELGGSYTGEIDGRGAVVHSDLNLNFLHASGEVWFPNSTVDGSLYAAGGHFRRSKVEPQSLLVKGVALDVNFSTIRGTEVLCCGFEIDGALVLAASSVGALFFTGGTFNNPNNIAILASGIRVDHIVFLGSSPFSHEGVRINGLVAFLSAHVAEALDIRDATFLGAVSDLHGFDATEMSADALLWQRVKLENGASMNLTGVTVNSLSDDSESWPAVGKLHLDGFTYAHLVGFASDGRSLLDARSRLRWLALQPEFNAQTYRQLAKVLRDSGDDSGATEVLIVAEDRRYAGYGRAGALMGAFLNLTIGYGHKPLRTIAWSLLVVLIGWPIVWMAKRAGVMRPTFPENIPQSSEPDYEELHPLLYALDAFLPFVNLHQEHYWWPNSKASGECTVVGYKFRLRGSLVRHYLWLQIFSGWLLSAILIAGVTGLMRND
jgi:hypothetical protein